MSIQVEERPLGTDSASESTQDVCVDCGLEQHWEEQYALHFCDCFSSGGSFCKVVFHIIFPSSGVRGWGGGGEKGVSL